MLAKYFCGLLVLVSVHTWSYTSSEESRFIPADSELSSILIYPELTQSIYQGYSLPILWGASDAIQAFEFQLSLIVQAQISPTFERQLKQIRQYQSQNQWQELDILLTDTFISYLSYVENAPLAGKEWFFSEKLHSTLPPPSPHILSRLKSSVADDYLLEMVLSYAPPVGDFDQFKSIYSILATASDLSINRYKQEGLKRLGDKLLDKVTLVERIALVGVDTSMVAIDLPEFDQDLQVAIKSFQDMHGIKSDGIIGPNTIKWINMSFNDRLNSLALNAERARLWPRNRDSLIVVNVPSFEMKYWEGGEEVFESKVVVGRKSRKTPLLEINLDSVILNPTWNVPWKIMVKDILPKVKADESYLRKHNFQVIDGWRSMQTIDTTQIDWQTINFNSFPYRLRQKAGSHNALGLYKFNTPNKRAIYLHDTPSKSLFNKDFRAYSSGCIRVEHAEQLAELLFATKAKQAPNQSGYLGPNTKVRLKKRIPVHIIYQTVLFEDDGIKYRGDIYQYDKQGG
ncbi:L,D-transpeptidase family protein [uncultured Vibrio sp.]|uniref:L,D-transpeptidase family protein n=1 Tax=uncultured Vibrio sp. TaxID=114054 RepID=UPI00260D7B64|nr:L,D-transpeptidase family protein [uncultured Vibrio sp.]